MDVDEDSHQNLDLMPSMILSAQAFIGNLSRGHVQSYTYVAFDHEIIPTAILLPSAES